MIEHERVAVVDHKPVCRCGLTGVRNDKYDAYYCPTSKEWLERPCCEEDRLIGDAEECEFCDNRPEKAP